MTCRFGEPWITSSASSRSDRLHLCDLPQPEIRYRPDGVSLTMRRMIATALILSCFAPSVLLAVDRDKAAYFGGSVPVFFGAKDPVEGILNTVDDTHLILRAEGKPFAGHELKIPYKSIQDLEYGQKAGRRVGAAIGYTVLLGPLGLLTLFSKKRNHYLTISWTEGDKEQVAVIELGKDIVRATLPIVKARSGKEITYQDEEAKKAGGA